MRGLVVVGGGAISKKMYTKCKTKNDKETDRRLGISEGPKKKKKIQAFVDK